MVFPSSFSDFLGNTAVVENLRAAIAAGRLPPGTHLFFSQYVVHRSPELWDNPLEFRPERHTPEAKATRPRFAYFAFGGGRRQCIGESFAWMEGVLALATIAQRWRLDFIPSFPVVPQAKITLRPRYPIMMRLQRRDTRCEIRETT